MNMLKLTAAAALVAASLSASAMSSIADEDLSVDFAALANPGDRVAVVATEPLTTGEPWRAFAPGELRVFRGGCAVS